VWTEMFLEKFSHRPAEIQRVLLVSKPCNSLREEPRECKRLGEQSAARPLLK
jgi:hypothetical protein